MSMLKLYSIAFKNRIKIERKDISGGFAKPIEKEVIIPRNLFHTETRQTLAHELGHCLHPLGSVAPIEEDMLLNMVGIVTDNVLRQEFAAWEWAADHTKINPFFLYKNLWSYASRVNYKLVCELGKEFETVWKMCEALLPADEPPIWSETVCESHKTATQVMEDKIIPPFTGWDSATTNTVYGKENKKHIGGYCD